MVAPSGSSIGARRAGADVRPSAAPVAHDRIRLAVGWPSEASRKQILAWLDAGLRPGRPGRLEREYPLLFTPDSEATPIGLFDGDAPVAFCILWPSRFALGSGALRAGLVSLVYTDPAHRRRGLARRVVEAAMTTATRQGLGLVVLWSELDDFYRDQGFARAGVETLLLVDEPILARARAATITTPAAAEGSPASRATNSRPASASAERRLEVDVANAADWPAILELRRARSCHGSLSDPGGRLAAIPGLDVRVARRAGSVVGFAMRGRGDDFEGVVHEWGGEVEAVLACCAKWLPADDPAAGFLMLSPLAASPLTACLRRAGARVVARPLAHFRIASLPALQADLEGLLPGFATRRFVRADALDAAVPRLRIEDPGSPAAIELDEAVLFDALFGSVGEASLRRARAELAGILPAGAVEALPLPFFVWGLESI